MTVQHEVVLSDGTRLTRFPVGFAYGQVFLNFAARTEGEDFGEDGFSSLAHIRLEQNGHAIHFAGGGGGGTGKNWSDHIEFDWTDFDGPTFDIVYFDESGELDRETLSLQPNGEWMTYPTRRIRVMPEYGIEWPVWDREGQTSPAEFADLSAELVSALREWALVFARKYDHETGWPEGFDHEAYFTEGRRLTERLQDELGDEVEVRFEA